MLITNVLRLASLSLCLFFSANLAAETLFTATYKGKHSGISIKLTRELEQLSETEFRLHSKAKSFIGSITELSQFKLENGTIIPSQYDYSRKLFGRKSVQTLSFDWEHKHADYKRSDKPERNATYALTPNALDPSLYQLKLQQELFRGQDTFNFDFAKDGRMKNIAFSVTSKSTQYRLDKRELEATQVERINYGKEKKTEILLLPALQYQIAEIVHTETDGSQYKLSLVDFKSDRDALSRFYNAISITENTDSSELAKQSSNILMVPERTGLGIMADESINSQ